MKRIFLVLLVGMLLTSCALFGGRRGRVSDSSSESTVPKAQYDELLQKYNELVHSHQAPTNNEVSDVVEDLSKVKSSPNLSQENTIDVFSKQKEMQPSNEDLYIGEDSVEKQITAIRKAQSFIAQNKFNEALILLKELDKSPIRQIKVRAKFYTAEIMFEQKEYDLAMQIYEEIITQYAFSGIVLKALGKVVVCTERLKLAKKQEQYYSLLHDFFEGT